MTTIISGKYRGRRLYDYKNPKVRPTQAKVRKSMLQILEPFQDSCVLDLFAGIGTLGIEAISRGAKSVTMVEKSSQAYRALSQNVDDICKNDNYKLVHSDVFSFLEICENKFDIIIADPPYGLCEYYDLRAKIIPLLKTDGLFCMEMSKTKFIDDDVRIKNYGNTQVVFWRAN
ncbi:MAG: RsmD family RNA methyltransferase [Candidatus Marinimicrobia bacterium]|nr:RsmD family RNA methyltransferase [Candidatus Neomarinimicrobiota bacterium]MBL7023361.1 RsmD family RNA methyltransferase [Candidatus Neomarinimicrobiota bacterium]MBL7109320.1 RsmD family RNA methyltransferase [Candidatus Neomarinimicrobiota bacterium]